MLKIKLPAILTFSLIMLFISSCVMPGGKQRGPIKVQIQGEAQGTYYSITYYDSLGRNFAKEIRQLLDDFDLSCSNYKENSIISKVNRNEEVELDNLFIGNFELAQEVARETNGDFDITVRPLVELWGFGLKNRENVEPGQVDSIMEFVGYRKIRLENNRIVKDDLRIMIDYNAIAQGYSVDEVSTFLDEKGIKSYLVDIGGEIYARNTKPGGKRWKVGVERPKDGETYGENLSAVIYLQNKGLATSGNYRKFYIKDGVKYAHTIDPHTGYPVQHSLLSATVLAPDAATADAYATAFMVMGVEKAKRILKKHTELDAYLVYSDTTGSYRSYATPGMRKLLEETTIQ